MSGLKADTLLENREFIKLALDYGVLNRVDVWHKNTEEGDPAIVLACGDMDQASDRLQHCWERFTPKTQLVTLNGIGVRTDGLSPANQPLNYIPCIVAQIRETIRLKEAQLNRDRPADQPPIRFERIVHYVDSHCGVASDHEISVQQSIRYAINGKQFLKDTFPGRTVVLKFYLSKPAELLGSDHPIVAKNPGATALTFYYSSKAMLDFIDIFNRDHAPLLTA